MIFPFWLNISLFKRAPVTMMLLALNVFFYLVLPMKNGVNLPPELARKVSQRDFISVQSVLYENYLRKNHVQEWRTWMERFRQRKESISGNEVEEFWFQLSFRDGDFLKKVPSIVDYPDKVRWRSWKKVFDEFTTHQKNDFSGLFGVSLYGGKWSHYLTYQFVHAGFLHLFSNMLILVMFGVLIEVQSGSWIVLLLYLLGGAAGGLFYSSTTGNNIAPLIGASGSVSALITFLLLTEPRRYLRFFFFLFPSEDYFGDIYLSKWWLISLLILGDINAVLTTPDWNLSVAHTAHIGAVLFGGLAAFIFKQSRFRSELTQVLTWIKHPEEEVPDGSGTTPT